MSDAATLSLRDAEPDDCERVWTWANDPQTRRMSFNSDTIPWEVHQRWFADKLGDERCLFYIVSQPEAGSVGLVRFDTEPTGDAVVSILIAAEHRGRGYSSEALRLACRAARDARPDLVVHAYVRPDNAASVSAFTRVGFDSHPMCDYAGQRALHLISKA